MLTRSTLFFLFAFLFLVSCRTEEPVATAPAEVVEAAETALPTDPARSYGELFDAVQMQQVFPDGKTFVDCIPKQDSATIMAAYRDWKGGDSDDLKAFVLQYFDLPPTPASGFVSDTTRNIAQHISALWPILTRQPTDGADRGTLIPLPDPYIVPGGRFREIYYWDSYFTLLGLQADGQEEMVKNMVDNFAYLIDRVGFIPNGNRAYYLTRSQPPFFSHMVEVLAEGGDDPAATYVAYLPQLRKEYDWWMEGSSQLTAENPTNLHTVRMADGSILNRYYDRGDYPRSESYREDVETARAAPDREAARVYRDLRSGAESGWDFTSRWFDDGKSISTVRTTAMVPPDLNALLYHLETTLAKAYAAEDDQENGKLFTAAAEARSRAINTYLWDEAKGCYQDYDHERGEFTGRLSLATVYPLFTHCSDAAKAARIAKLLRTDFLQPGGLLSTPTVTGQQWDAPNGWPPLQWMAYRGLLNYEQPELAGEVRSRWMTVNERVYGNVFKMVEKYVVTDMTLLAGGGEYPVQDGFGWSNGVYRAMLAEGEDKE
ncbi:MAG: alpha,alpha-trehalase TreF [Saprospiraceae bacterium]